MTQRPSQLHRFLASGIPLPPHLARLTPTSISPPPSSVTPQEAELLAPHLWYSATGLAYRSFLDGTLRELRVDFLSPAMQHRRKQGLGGIGMLYKALGRPSEGAEVVDATAGLGEDSFLLAAAGFRVTAIEANPAVFLLLTDAHARLAALEPNLAQHLTFHCGNAEDQALAGKLVYLDPMFPQKKKAALPSIEMRLLAALTAGDGQGQGLLRVVLKKGVNRVAVKRPRHAPYLDGLTPSHQIEGKAVRFDVYTAHHAS